MGETAETPQGDPLQLLLGVQQKDLQADQLAYRRRELEERKKLAVLDEELTELASRTALLGAKRDELSRKQAEIEGHVSAYGERIAAIEARLRQGGAYREMQAMSGEVESLGRHRRELEDRQLEVMEALEPVEAELAELAGETERRAGERGRLAGELSAAEAEIDEELAAVGAEREGLAAGLPPSLASTYERLRQRLGGVGAARLVDGRCSGCHLQLPSSERERLLHAPVGTVAYCDQCGRILVP